MHLKGRKMSGNRAGTCGRCGRFQCVCGTSEDPRRLTRKRDKIVQLQAKIIRYETALKAIIEKEKYLGTPNSQVCGWAEEAIEGDENSYGVYDKPNQQS